MRDKTIDRQGRNRGANNDYRRPPDRGGTATFFHRVSHRPIHDDDACTFKSEAAKKAFSAQTDGEKQDGDFGLRAFTAGTSSIIAMVSIESLMKMLPCLLGFVTLSAVLLADEKPPPAPQPPAQPPPAAKLFPDSALEAAVRRNVFAKRENQEPLAEQDVQNISTIEAHSAGIKDLTGLEKCTALALLDVAKNQVTNLAPIKGLARLQSLTLTGNQVADISPLSECKALQYIELTGNKVEDLKPLSGLAALNSLYLSDNQIKDATPVFSCTKLWSLYLDGNKLTGIQGVGALHGLTTLSLRKNALTDLSPLEPLEQLNMIFLENNQLADVAPLHRMLKKDFEGRKRFAPFVRIWLNGNPLSDESKKLVDELKHLGCRIEL
jgi:internalin A